MSDRQWEKFFELLNAIVNGQGTAAEKAAEVARRAAANSSDGDLEEFLSWDFPDAAEAEEVEA